MSSLAGPTPIGLRAERGAVLALLGLLVVGPVPGHAAQARTQPTRTAGPPAPPDSVTAIPHAQFNASGLHRFLLGRTYRELWTQPIRIGVLDLSTFEGGLEVVARDNPARPFHFRAADGRIFGFRELVKDATLDWPERQRTGFLRKLAQDQISSTIPAGVLAVGELERAAGVIRRRSEFVVLPDDAKLGQFRKAFAGTPGILEHRLGESAQDLLGVPGARELVDSDTLFQRLRSDGASRVDAAAYLTARLVDLLVGDWDRHDGQWTWARFDDPVGHRWVPIPSDRDWAFNRLDGLFGMLVRSAQPKFQKFDGRLGGLKGLLIRSEALDRRLLTSLDRTTWDSVVMQLISRLNDGVIAAAVAALPAQFDRDAMTWLTEALKQRRAGLPAAADAFYRRLAGVVEVWGTEGPDRIALEETPDGGVSVSVARAGGAGHWARKFLPGETREVRVYTLGGADTITGTQGGRIRIRIIDDGGGELSVERTVQGAMIYDSTRSFASPVKPFDPEVMLRDWGGGMGLAPWVDYQWGVGLILGGGPALTRFGFRRVPYASRITARLAYATGFSGTNADLLGDFRFENPGLRLVVAAAALSKGVGYFGQGNSTSRIESVAYYLVRQRSYSFEPRLAFKIGGRSELSLGGFARLSESNEDHPTLAALEQPYGIGSFAAIGAAAGWELDLRDHPANPTRGFRLRVSGRYFPSLLDVEAPFGVLHGELGTFVTGGFLPAKPTLALRVGGSRAWGQTPFFEAPAVGGLGSLRGFLPRRFSGDAALFGSAEVRLDFGGFKLLVPGDWGIYGLGDVGRVYLDGESSSTWHHGWGAGLWVAVFDKKSTITITYAGSREPGRLYIYNGFHF